MHLFFLSFTFHLNHRASSYHIFSPHEPEQLPFYYCKGKWGNADGISGTVQDFQVKV